jgi:ClpP class serine protease
VPLEASQSIKAAVSSDPQELLRSLARARKSHVVVLGAGDRHSAPGADNSEIILLEEFLQQYRHIAKEQPIDLLLLRDLNPPASAIRHIARVLDAHPGRVTAIIPFQAWGSIGLLALAADEIIMAADAALVLDTRNTAAVLKAASTKTRRHMSEPALVQLHRLEQNVRETEWLTGLLLKSRKVRRWRKIAREISRGVFHEGHPLYAEDLRSWGLKVETTGIVDEIQLPSDTVKLLSGQRTLGGPMVSTAPTCSAACPIGDVRDAMVALESRRGTRLISIIHSDGMSEGAVGVQTTAEAIKAIRGTPSDMDLDIILHTPGGSALGAGQIVRALKAHKGRKTFFVPYEAFSAGTILALTGNEIFMSEIASLGPIDVQYQGIPAAALASLLKHKRVRDMDDEALKHAIKADNAMRAYHNKAVALMRGNYSRLRAERIARTLNSGYLSHGFPLMYKEARMTGLHVRLGVPDEVFTIVDSALARNDGFCSVIHCPD